MKFGSDPVLLAWQEMRAMLAGEAPELDDLLAKLCQRRREIASRLRDLEAELGDLDITERVLARFTPESA